MRDNSVILTPPLIHDMYYRDNADFLIYTANSDTREILEVMLFVRATRGHGRHSRVVKYKQC